jgi:hypothetical protein
VHFSLGFDGAFALLLLLLLAVAAACAADARAAPAVPTGATRCARPAVPGSSGRNQNKYSAALTRPTTTIVMNREESEFFNIVSFLLSLGDPGLLL